MKKRKVSLAFKLNILIITIIVTISVTLLAIGFSAYRQMFARYRKNLKQFAAELKEKAEKDYEPVLKYCSICFQSEEFKEAKRKNLEGSVGNAFSTWLLETPASSSDRADSFLNELVDFLIAMDKLCTDFPVDAVVTVAKTGDGWMQVCRAEREDLLLSYDNISYLGAPAEKVYISEKDAAPKLLERDGTWEMACFLSLKTDDFSGGIWLCCDVTENIREQWQYLHTCIISVLGLTAIFITAAMILLKKMATGPLRQLSEATNEFAVEKDSFTREDIMQLDIRSNDEIGDLYRDIQSMQGHIVEYTENLTRMTAEKEKERTELNVASSIQNGVLPHVFPPYPDRTEFDIYASMDPAKEVGGDFYDFFLIDDDHLCLVIADVSGKGVPAALFMMTAKLILKNCAMLGKTAAGILTATNESICPNNQASMFVTVWVGILEISTGRLTAANAGHEYPAVYRAKKGRFELLRDMHGFVVGAMEGMKYTEYDLQLCPGDKVFVYTDGVPEANDTEGRMFGTDSMIAALNETPEGGPEKTLKNVRGAVDAFVKGAEQFDDLTMLCMEYRGKKN